MEMSIPQLEFIMQGCHKNAKDIEKGMNQVDTLEGADAIKYLMQTGEIKA